MSLKMSIYNRALSLVFQKRPSQFRVIFEFLNLLTFSKVNKLYLFEIIRTLLAIVFSAFLAMKNFIWEFNISLAHGASCTDVYPNVQTYFVIGINHFLKRVLVPAILSDIGFLFYAQSHLVLVLGLLLLWWRLFIYFWGKFDTFFWLAMIKKLQAAIWILICLNLLTSRRSLQFL